MLSLPLLIQGNPKTKSIEISAQRKGSAYTNHVDSSET
jgi:hypothetical protein